MFCKSFLPPRGGIRFPGICFWRGVREPFAKNCRQLAGQGPSISMYPGSKDLFLDRHRERIPPRGGKQFFGKLVFARGPKKKRKDFSISDRPIPVKNNLFRILEILTFPKSPEIDPPPRGDPNFRKLVFARGPKTPANKISVIDWPKAVKIEEADFFKIYSLGHRRGTLPHRGGIHFSGRLVVERGRGNPGSAPAGRRPKGYPPAEDHPMLVERQILSFW